MTDYANDIPSLPVLQSGIDDEPAAAILAGDDLDESHIVAATRQYKNRKHLAAMEPPQATQAELVSAKRRKHNVESAHFDGPTPLWAQQMQHQLQTQMQQLQTQMQQQQTQLEAQMQTHYTQLGRRIEIESQRSMNRSRRSTNDHIQPLVRMDGQTPLDTGIFFPANQIELEDITVNNLNSLLQFYGLATDGLRGPKKDRLKQHLGVVL
jgi:hypothetical protein